LSQIETSGRTTVTTGPDAITFEVLRNAFVALVNEMALSVELAAFSLAISEGRDFSGTLYNRDGHLIAQGEQDLPVHVGTAQFTVSAVIDAIGTDAMQDGDVYLMNDPYAGGTHLNDVRLVLPIFVDDDLVGYVASTAHWTDVGGMVPGSFAAQLATECYQEGLRLPPIRIVRDGRIDPFILSIILANVRVPRDAEGDLNAQLAACYTGRARFLELVEKYGIEVIDECMSELIEISERLLRAEVERLPDGDYNWVDHVDEDFFTGLPKRIELTLRIRGDQLTYDFTGTDPAARSSINCTLSSAISAVFITAKAIFSEIPFSYGILRALEIVAPVGSMVNAQPPSPVGGFGATAYEKICTAALCAFSRVVPERTIAGSYNLLNTFWGGRDPDGGRDYVCYVWSAGGIGAGHAWDGPHAMQTFLDASTTSIPAEVIERMAPIVIERDQLRPNTCGAGRHQGGLGCDKTIRLARGDARLTVAGDRGKFMAPGLFGGRPAPTQDILKQARRPDEESLGVCVSNYELNAGETISILSMGGAGYGHPLDRDPDLILEHVIDEYIDEEFARREYGVVVEVIDREALDIRLDRRATSELRAEMRRRQETS
jgi:N-methylhydantoinase B